MKHSPSPEAFTAHGARRTAHGARRTARRARHAERGIAFRTAIALACLAFIPSARAQYPPAEDSAEDSSAQATIERLYWDHVEGFCIADSIGNDIYIGSREHLFHTSDAGRTWKKLGQLPQVNLIKEIIPINPRIIFVNASKGFTGEAFVSHDSGRTFCPCVVSTGGGACAWFLRDEGVVYVAAQTPFCIMESKDSGTTWSEASLPIDTLKNPRICSLLVEKRGGRTKFFVSTSAQATIYETSSLGGKWHKCFVDAWGNWNRELPLITIWGNRLVACVASGPNGSKQEIYLSENDGKSWRGINCPFEIWGVGVNASDSKTMWIGNFGSWIKSDKIPALQYSKDNGRSWTAVKGCKAKWFWQLEELSNHSLYAATDYGLIRVKLND